MTTNETPGAAIEGQVVLQAIEALADAVERLDLERAEAIRERDEAIALLRAWQEADDTAAAVGPYSLWKAADDARRQVLADIRAYLSRFPEGGEG